MAICNRPDMVMRSGNIMPAGCYYDIQRVVKGIARDFTSDPSVVAKQYGPTAGEPVVERSGGGSPPFVPSVPAKRPNFLARFFGAK